MISWRTALRHSRQQHRNIFIALVLCHQILKNGIIILFIYCSCFLSSLPIYFQTNWSPMVSNPDPKQYWNNWKNDMSLFSATNQKRANEQLLQSWMNQMWIHHVKRTYSQKCIFLALSHLLYISKKIKST